MTARGPVLLRFIGRIILGGGMLTSPLFFLSAETSPSAQVSAPLPAPAIASSSDLQLSGKPWWKGITVNGYASLSYTYNTNDPSSRLNQFRVFDFNEDEPQLDVAQLVIQHPVGEPGQLGFRFNIMAGSGVPEITASYGMFRNTTTAKAHHFDIPEGYLSYVAPVGNGLRFDAGKFATHLGYEVIGGYDGYNDNFSRVFIFGYGVPFTHTGVKISYTFNRRISSAFMITNGCDAVTRLNGGITFGGQLAAVTSKTTTLTFNFLHGPERPQNAHDQRSLYELTGSWRVIPRLSFAFDGLYADVDHAAIDGSDA